jgi:hypothetical protein
MEVERRVQCILLVFCQSGRLLTLPKVQRAIGDELGELSRAQWQRAFSQARKKFGSHRPRLDHPETVWSMRIALAIQKIYDERGVQRPQSENINKLLPPSLEQVRATNEDWHAAKSIFASALFPELEYDSTSTSDWTECYGRYRRLLDKFSYTLPDGRVMAGPEPHVGRQVQQAQTAAVPTMPTDGQPMGIEVPTMPTTMGIEVPTIPTTIGIEVPLPLAGSTIVPALVVIPALVDLINPF